MHFDAAFSKMDAFQAIIDDGHLLREDRQQQKDEEDKAGPTKKHNRCLRCLCGVPHGQRNEQGNNSNSPEAPAKQLKLLL